jgi:HSP20 family protein
MRASFSYNPLADADALRRELDRAVSSFFGGGNGSLFATGRRAYPPMNFSEDAEALHVQVLAPGLNAETLNVEINNGFLRVSGEKVGLGEEIKPEARHREERRSGQFSRAVELPFEVDRDKTTAQYRDGILSIRLPKAERAKPKRVVVTAS